MITAVDTSVLLDVFGADPTFGLRSRSALRDALTAGRVLACDVVWAEVAPHFPSVGAALLAMDRLGVEFSPIERDVALGAGSAWRLYRERGGARQRVIADFLIGAHASAQAEGLLTRDRGFYRTYFRRLRLFDPTLP